MSARPLTLAATAAVCGVLLAPAAASADTPAGLTAAISDATHTTVTRGHGQDAFTLTVTNNSATAQSYAGQWSRCRPAARARWRPGRSRSTCGR
jgi:hypothetical protein